MIHADENDFNYYETLDEAKADGLFPIKVTSLLQFFTLSGKKSIISRENMTPIPDLRYCVFTSAANRYYIREYRGYSISELYFVSLQNEAKHNLRRYVEDGTVTLLMDKDQVADTTDMLKRLWTAKFKTEGKLSYPIYLEIVKAILDLEDYKDYGKSLVGFKTVINQFDLQIKDLWQKASESKR